MESSCRPSAAEVGDGDADNESNDNNNDDDERDSRSVLIGYMPHLPASVCRGHISDEQSKKGACETEFTTSKVECRLRKTLGQEPPKLHLGLRTTHRLANS